MNDGSSDDQSPGYGDSTEQNWLSWFTSLEGHQYMVKVNESYIRDAFNLFGIQQEMNLTKERF